MSHFRILKRFSISGDWSEMLFVCWKTFFWLFTVHLLEIYFFNVPVFFQIVTEFWLITVIFKTPGSGVKFVVFTIDNFPLFNDSIVNIWIKVVPLIYKISLSFSKINLGSILHTKWINTRCISLFITGIKERSSSFTCRTSKIKCLRCWNSKLLAFTLTKVAETFVCLLVIWHQIEVLEYLSSRILDRVIVVINLTKCVIWRVSLNLVHFALHIDGLFDRRVVEIWF